MGLLKDESKMFTYDLLLGSLVMSAPTFTGIEPYALESLHHVIHP